MIQTIIFSSKNLSQGVKAGPPPPEEFKQKLEALGIPSDVIQQGPQAVKQYADKNGISLPPPPSRPNGANGEPPEEFKQKLEALGIPAETIAQGRDAVMQYAQENGIEIPKPPLNQNIDITA
ncbi:MAG: hypothetical protein V2B14_01355 [bacterium]